MLKTLGFSSLDELIDATIPRKIRWREGLSLPQGVTELLVLIFFFSSRRRHTIFDCDWSSDVCSSDLGARLAERPRARPRLRLAGGRRAALAGRARGSAAAAGRPAAPDRQPLRARGHGDGIGRASWRGRGEISVVAVSFKKKKKKIHME